jgi:hypothetical protein
LQVFSNGLNREVRFCDWFGVYVHERSMPSGHAIWTVIQKNLGN